MFFFSSRRRHTRSLCDWSSDVCSSDLGRRQCLVGDRCAGAAIADKTLPPTSPAAYGDTKAQTISTLEKIRAQLQRDRKKVGKGKRVDLGGRRIIKKKKRSVRK